MKMQTFIVKIGTLLGSIKGAFLEAFAGNKGLHFHLFILLSIFTVKRLIHTL